MIRRIFVLTASILPTIAAAQTVQDGFVRPPDVPVYVDQFDGFEAGTTLNQVGDGSNARGGTMPILSTMPADIPSTAPGWIETTAPASGLDYDLVTDVDTQEAKMRFGVDPSIANFDDPIRNWGQPGTSHLHQWFGCMMGNAFSTYVSIRTRANALAAAGKSASTTPGGPYQATCYWYPGVIIPNPFADGKNYSLPVSSVAVYYVENPARGALSAQRIPRGLRYITGTNMSDPYDTERKAEIATANAQPGTAGRYAYGGNGFMGYQCFNNALDTVYNITVAEHPDSPIQNGTYYRGFKTAGGADPWGGTCPSDGWIVAELNGPRCFDGVNPWSPGGYEHVRQEILDNEASNGRTCSKGSFHLTPPRLTFAFRLADWSVRQNAYLSSDASATAAAQAINPAAPAMIPGQSFHTDWFGGWDDTTLMTWLNVAMDLDESGGMHAMQAARIDQTHTLAGGSGGAAPDGSRNPQTDPNDSYDPDTRADMIQVPASLTGPHVVHVH